MSIWKTWKDLTAKGVMGINRLNADYVLKYNKRHLYPVVDDKIITKERALEAGIHVPEMYGIIETEKGIDKLNEIIGEHNDFVIKPAQGAGGDGIMVIADRFEGRYKTVSGRSSATRRSSTTSRASSPASTPSAAIATAY